MLYYGQAKSCATCGLRSALVHSVESFKYPLLMLLRDSYSRILHPEYNLAILCLYRYIHTSILIVISDGVVCEVIHKLLHHHLVRIYISVTAIIAECHTVLLCVYRQHIRGCSGYDRQIDLLHQWRILRYIQL